MFGQRKEEGRKERKKRKKERKAGFLIQMRSANTNRTSVATFVEQPLPETIFLPVLQPRVLSPK
jgi:hypothetical protein